MDPEERPAEGPPQGTPPGEGEGDEGSRWSFRVHDPGGRMVWQAALPAAHLPRARVAAVVALALVAALIGSWALLAARAAQVPLMQRQLAERTDRDDQVERLANALEEVEAAYLRLQRLFAAEGLSAGALWLPPAGVSAQDPPSGTSAPRGPLDVEVGEPPSLWPLTERGFLTQGLVPAEAGEEEGQGHPGVDIAIPSGSYFRAVAAGRVLERGEDPVYGLFVVIEHAGGFRSLYGHASVVTVEPGREVQRGEVLGLTGSSGRSSAPHLHLEITRNGEHLDPLALLSRPGGG